VNRRERDKVATIVDDARRDGADVVVGGTVPDRTGYFYEPTVLRCSSPDDAILSREVFGPVAPIVTFAESADLPVLCNTESTGLAAYVMGGDERRCMDVADGIEVGMVGINRGIISDPAAPFGGRRRSGLGREGGLHGIEEFLEPKYIALPAAGN
jgi:succinate-semialdehyde dehydrogenase/glutarate-semialdehyde dehydrogenase